MTSDSKEISFFVSGICVPWERAGGQGKRRFTKPRTKEWQRKVRMAVIPARMDSVGKSYPVSGPLGVTMAFGLRNGTSMRADLDNLAKSVLDAMNGMAYKDDSQVVSLSARKFLATDCALGVHVIVREEA